MRTLGYNVPLTLTIAFTLSGFFAGVAGILFVFLNNFISPNNVALSQSVSGLLMVVLGGLAPCGARLSARRSSSRWKTWSVPILSAGLRSLD